MTSDRKAFTVKLLDLHGPFLAHCQAIGATPSHLLSQLARQVVQGVTPLLRQDAGHSPQVLVTMASVTEKLGLHSIADQHGLSAATAVRQACIQYLMGLSGAGAGAQSSNPLLRPGGYRVGAARADEGTIRCEIQLTQSEARALNAQVEEFGYPNVQALIIAIARSYLRRAPIVSPGVATALGEMNLSLIRIGKNVNQIARSINSERTGITSDQVDRLMAVMEGIAAQTKAISAELRQAAHRWDIEKVSE